MGLGGGAFRAKRLPSLVVVLGLEDAPPQVCSGHAVSLCISSPAHFTRGF